MIGKARSLSAILLILILLILPTVPGRGEEEEKTPAMVISEMISAFGSTGSSSSTEVLISEEELRTMDPVLADLWHGIIAYWEELNQPGSIHPERLPDGLPTDNSLCIVILGYSLTPDGAMKPELIGRLETGLACARQYPNAYVLCTGGGTAMRNKEATEADCMGAWLIENGLEPERLILENRSRTTTDNALFTAEILQHDYPGVRAVAIVSSAYHIPWGQLLFEAVFRRDTALNGFPEIHAVSNAAYMIDDPAYYDIVRQQMSALKSIINR